MPCYFPHRAYRSRKFGKDGKWPLSFSPNNACTDLPVMVPCGECEGCMKEKAQEWGIRIYAESRMYDENTILTLTYDPAHLPEGGTLVKEHVSGFMMRLRNHFGQGIRFYASGEYGDKFERPHYHCILFNYAPRDLQNVRKRDDYLVAESPKLSEIWGHGIVEVGEFSTAAAMYAAGYCVKKQANKKSGVDYKGRLPEFHVMSMRPGIGTPYLEKFRSNVYPKDYIVVDGRKYAPPTFFDKWLKKHHPRISFRIRKNRIEHVQANPGPDSVRLAQINECKKIIRKHKKERAFKDG